MSVISAKMKYWRCIVTTAYRFPAVRSLKCQWFYKAGLNIWESYIFQDGQPKHIYSQIEPDFHERRIAYVGYDAHHGSWVYSGHDADDKQYISEKKAMEIIYSFPWISLDMTPVTDFPITGNPH